MKRWMFLLLFVCGVARADVDPLEVLREPGAVGVMRHARAPGTGDPPGFRPGDCPTQRNLDAAGREEARAFGDMLRARGIRAEVFSSVWCRTRDTAALLGLGPVTPLPALNSFFDDRSQSAAQTAAVRRFIAGWRGPTLILVTHQVNITALTGMHPGDGEMIVLRRSPDGLVVAGRISPPKR
jgi:phosphohistidine phosphatase SixA